MSKGRFGPLIINKRAKTNTSSVQLIKNSIKGLDYLTNFIFRRLPQDESSFIGIQVSGQINSGKTTLVKCLVNKYINDNKLLDKNAVNIIYTNNLEDLIGSLNRRPLQICLVDDAVRRLSGRGSMSTGRQKSMADFLEIRHIYDEQLFPGHPAHLVLFFTVQIPDSGLDKQVRENIQVNIFKTIPSGKAGLEVGRHYLGNDQWSIQELNKITRGTTTGSLEDRGRFMFAVPGAVGVANYSPFFWVKNIPEWKRKITNTIGINQYIIKNANKLFERYGFEEISRKEINYDLLNDEEIESKHIAPIIKAFEGLIAKKHRLGEITSVADEEETLDLSDGLKMYENDIQNGYGGRWVPLRFFRLKYGITKTDTVIEKLLKIKQIESIITGEIKYLDFKIANFPFRVRDGSIQIFVPELLLLVLQGDLFN